MRERYAECGRRACQRVDTTRRRCGGRRPRTPVVHREGILGDRRGQGRGRRGGDAAVRGKQARMRDPPRPAAVNLPKPSGPAGIAPDAAAALDQADGDELDLIGHGKSCIGAQPRRN